MAKLVLTNSRIIIAETFARDDQDRIRELDELTSYYEEGYDYNERYLAGQWDGRVHMLRWSKKTMTYNIPTGMESMVRRMFPDAQVEDFRRRPKPGHRLQTEYVGYPLRDYQREASEAVVGPTRLGEPPRGIYKIPTRGGKTLVATHIFHQLGWPTMFIVPSDLLLRQTLQEFERSISAPGNWLGMIGRGKWDPQWVTVATIQSLIQDVDAAIKLLSQFDLILMDEAHHSKADVWRKPIMYCDSWGKVGLTATFFDDPTRANERASIWVRAATGPMLVDVPMDRLIRNGHLVAPDIFMFPFRLHGAPDRWDYGTTYDEYIATNLERNTVIAELAMDAVHNGELVLIDTGRISQMNMLYDLLLERGIRVRKLYGKTSADLRDHTVDAFKHREIDAIVGTILGEGVDIPELQVVINAEAGQSRTAVMQRFRNLTPAPGKDRAIFIDFYDIGQKHLTAHSASRLETYQNTPGFRPHLIPSIGGRPARIPWHLLGQRQKPAKVG